MGYLQAAWDEVVTTFGTDTITYRFGINWGLLIFIYYGLGSIFAFFDLTLSPQALRKYKSQLKANEPMDRKKFWHMMRQVAFNNFVVGAGMTFLYYKNHMLINGPDSPEFIRTLPSAFTILWHIAVSVVIEEFLFYYSHWFLHWRAVYKHVHKQHHEWTAPIAWAAVYCHPIEHVISNMFPPTVGPLLLNSHPVILYLWFGFVVVQTLFDHSGYHFPFLMSNEFHDFHHLKFNQCYGTNLGLLDWFNGTDKMWREKGTYFRHRVLYGLKSARELYPCETDKASYKSEEYKGD